MDDLAEREEAAVDWRRGAVGSAAGLGAFLAWLGGGVCVGFLSALAFFAASAGGETATAGDHAAFFAGAAVVVAVVAAASALPALALGARWPYVLAAGGAVYALAIGGLVLSSTGALPAGGYAEPLLLVAAPAAVCALGILGSGAGGGRRLRGLSAVLVGGAVCFVLAASAAGGPPDDFAWAEPLVLALSSWVLLPAVAGCVAGGNPSA